MKDLLVSRIDELEHAHHLLQWSIFYLFDKTTEPSMLI